MQKDLKSNDREKRNGRVGKNKGEVEMRREREKGMGRRRKGDELGDAIILS